MTIEKITRVIYGLVGVVYVLIGAGSMLLPTGWFPQSLTDAILVEAMRSSFVEHLLQEFGTVVLALGFVFLWHAKRKEHSRSFHWAMTFYFSLDALIHWVGPEGFIRSWRRGIANSFPLAVMLLLGLLQPRAPKRMRVSGAAEQPVAAEAANQVSHRSANATRGRADSIGANVCWWDFDIGSIDHGSGGLNGFARV